MPTLNTLSSRALACGSFTLLKAVFDCKPLGVAFAIGVVRITFIQQVAQLVDENIVTENEYDRLVFKRLGVYKSRQSLVLAGLWWS